jgi:F0F1-type ATP synthase assembly protein I
MKIGLNIVGVLLFLTGVVWFFQGIGVILGSFMSNTTQWTLIGLLCIVLGAGLLVVNNRRQKQK